MCSFIFTNKEITDLEYVNFYNKFRGPDKTNISKINGYSFLHNLLSITGEFTLQPFVDGNIVCLYNGEIYNYEDLGSYKSDGECLIPLYKEHGIDFIKKLDGEFAITLVDFNKKIIVISTDTFKTKPIFYSLTDGIGTSSYSEPLRRLGFENVVKMEPNTTLVINLETNEIIEKRKVHEFDVSNQNKGNYDDWCLAFENSIKKRTKNVREKIFIGLSGGYDSGAICCELLNQNTPFKSYTVVGTENNDILNKRFSLLKNNEQQTLTKSFGEIQPAYDYIRNNTEHFKFVTYSNSSDYNEFWLSLIDDNGAKHLSHVCSYAKKDGKKILLSGQGADEIFSDYGFGGVKKYNHSNFGGLFPEDLNTIFPWPSFFNSSMESYLAKEEYVAGSYGIESRYPFLDLDVIQEFLWLKPELKNLNYKSVLYYYLNKNKFPFTENEKVGF
jgi:asparagine synthetase B (glutamine-hydrolysing)